MSKATPTALIMNPESGEVVVTHPTRCRVHPKEHYAQVANPFWQSLPAHARREAHATGDLLSSGPLTITAEMDGQTIGMVEVGEVGVGLPDPAAPLGRRGLVSPTIVVHPEHRRAGVATALMEVCVSLVRRQGDLLLAEVIDFRNRSVVSLALRSADLISVACWKTELLRQNLLWAPVWSRPDLPADVKALLDRHHLLPVPVDLTPENAHEMVVLCLSAISLSQTVMTGRVPGLLGAYRAGLKHIDRGITQRELEQIIVRSMERASRTASMEALAKALKEESDLILGMAPA
jgi:GNAT superfamily N-acetyltransferase